MLPSSLRFCISFFYFLILLSCEREPDLLFDKDPDSLVSIFDNFWLRMNSNYLYWDIENTDWDNIRDQYRPKFERLNINDLDDLQKATDYFKGMSKGFIDGHFLLDIDFQCLPSTSYQPSWERKEIEPDFHELYHYESIVKEYLVDDYLQVRDNDNVMNGESLSVITGSIDKGILYFSCNRLSLFKSYTEKQDGEIRSVLDSFFSQINGNTKIKGVIIDVRGVLGGDLEDLNFFLGRMIDHPLHFGYTQYKNDQGRTDYTPWIKAFVNPSGVEKAFTKPIVVLGDKYSASLAEFIILAVKSMSNGIFIGERTWGATGVIVNSEIYDSGQFNIGSYLNVKISSARFKSLEGNVYEGIGVPPDVPIAFDIFGLNQKKDVVLEEAIQVINGVHK